MSNSNLNSDDAIQQLVNSVVDGMQEDITAQVTIDDIVSYLAVQYTTSRELELEQLNDVISDGYVNILQNLSNIYKRMKDFADSKIEMIEPIYQQLESVTPHNFYRLSWYPAIPTLKDRDKYSSRIASLTETLKKRVIGNPLSGVNIYPNGFDIGEFRNPYYRECLESYILNYYSRLLDALVKNYTANYYDNGFHLWSSASLSSIDHLVKLFQVAIVIKVVSFNKDRVDVDTIHHKWIPNNFMPTARYWECEDQDTGYDEDSYDEDQGDESIYDADEREERTHRKHKMLEINAKYGSYLMPFEYIFTDADKQDILNARRSFNNLVKAKNKAKDILFSLGYTWDEESYYADKNRDSTFNSIVKSRIKMLLTKKAVESNPEALELIRSVMTTVKQEVTNHYKEEAKKER